MGVWMPRKSLTLHGGSLLLVTWIILCSGTEESFHPAAMVPSVYKVIENKSVLPFCFTTHLYDLTCFWESNSSDVSSYTFSYYAPVFSSQNQTTQNKRMEPCNLTVVPASNDTWWHMCQFPVDHVEYFAMSSYAISVMDNREHTTMWKREFFPTDIVYLQPLKNVTVREQVTPLGLLVIVKDPSNTFPLTTAFVYQVNYSTTKSELQKTKMFDLVAADTDGYVKLFLSDLIKRTTYTVSVRVKTDIPYDSYWSEWSVVTFQTSNGDVLHIVLFVIGGLIPVAAIILVSLYHGRFLKSKAWPNIPSPEHHFKELYTTHKGNFKLWLDQTDSYLTWISRNIFDEGTVSSVEVLSELPNAAPSLPPSVQLPPKDSYVSLDENMMPHFSSWVVSQRQIQVRREQPSTAAVPSEEKTLRPEARPKESSLREEASGEESAVDEGKSELLNGAPGCRIIVRGDSLNSEEGKQSPGSSFEYTVLETCDGLLSPRTRSIPPRQPLKYAYLGMSESGDETPPPSSTFYQNSPCGHFLSPVYSQC
ncbi:erythropoietin receptor [Pseudophryne corroboree]|uniref:erythropoietin receptor n=1 Tax=Pseudophryne corroboree TaxID=495146 RepID=UPI003081EE97